MEIDYKSTADVIRDAAKVYRGRADELDTMAKELEKEKDFSYASYALMVIAGTMQNLRLDLLMVRPLRALGYGEGLSSTNWDPNNNLLPPSRGKAKRKPPPKKKRRRKLQ